MFGGGYYFCDRCGQSGGDNPPNNWKWYYARLNCEGVMIINQLELNLVYKPEPVGMWKRAIKSLSEWGQTEHGMEYDDSLNKNRPIQRQEVSIL